MQFEWDARKDAANQRKHGIGFREATTVFGDPLATTFLDPNGRLLVVVHAERGNAARIISARSVTPRERKFYEEDH